MDGTQRLNITISQHIGPTVPSQWINHQVSVWLCLVLPPFISNNGLFLLLALGFSYANKLSLLLLSVFAFSMASLASKALMLSGVFLPFMVMAFFWSSYNFWCFAIDIESYSSLQYFFNSIFPLKVPWVVLVFCHLALNHTDRDNLHIWCWCTFVNILHEEVIWSMKILLVLVLVCPYCSNCYGHLVTPDAIQQISNLWSWIKALVPIFHKISQDNMLLDMLGNILFPFPQILFFIIHRHLEC